MANYVELTDCVGYHIRAYRTQWNPIRVLCESSFIGFIRLLRATNFRFDLVGSGAQPGTSSPDDGSNFSGQPVLINCMFTTVAVRMHLFCAMISL